MKTHKFFLRTILALSVLISVYILTQSTKAESSWYYNLPEQIKMWIIATEIFASAILLCLVWYVFRSKQTELTFVSTLAIASINILVSYLVFIERVVGLLS